MTAYIETAAQATARPRATVRSQVVVPLRFPDGFTATAEVLTFHGLADGKEHLLLALGKWEQALLQRVSGPRVSGPRLAGAGLPEDVTAAKGAPLVRLHSECMTGDVFGSQRCDCGPQLREAVEDIAAVGGFLLYLRQEGRGIGLYSKLDAYALQDTGLDTYEANLALGHGEDERDYTAAAQMLDALGATKIRLLSNNPDKGAQLRSRGIDIIEQVPTGVHLSPGVETYAEVIRRLSRGCASTAWTAGHLSSTPGCWRAGRSGSRTKSSRTGRRRSRLQPAHPWVRPGRFREGSRFRVTGVSLRG
ncbi:GTP cyclohydrolase II [Arthrobacter sp. NPDC093125]|uniref:GTP cyclohydrolase II n=1 Tax=Arthrobacter sp. NPDC093125 TaxID=3363944 RepID=UPI003829937E